MSNKPNYLYKKIYFSLKQNISKSYTWDVEYTPNFSHFPIEFT